MTEEMGTSITKEAEPVPGTADLTAEIESEAIFNDQTDVVIVHRGHRYRLQDLAERGLRLTRESEHEA